MVTRGWYLNPEVKAKGHFQWDRVYVRNSLKKIKRPLFPGTVPTSYTLIVLVTLQSLKTINGQSKVLTTVFCGLSFYFRQKWVYHTQSTRQPRGTRASGCLVGSRYKRVSPLNVVWIRWGSNPLDLENITWRSIGRVENGTSFCNRNYITCCLFGRKRGPRSMMEIEGSDKRYVCRTPYQTLF